MHNSCTIRLALLCAVCLFNDLQLLPVRCKLLIALTVARFTRWKSQVQILQRPTGAGRCSNSISDR
jgi:hypothetical protein